MFKNRKSGHHHSILHLQISHGTRFQLKLTILIFWIKFQSKTGTVNITMEFGVFELV